MISMRFVYIIGLSILMMVSLTCRVEAAVKLEIVDVYISSAKTFEPTVIEVRILNREGIGQHFTLFLYQQMDVGCYGNLVDWYGYITAVSGYANPSDFTFVSFVLSPIRAGRVKISIGLFDYLRNLVDEWDGYVTIEKGIIETQIDFINGNLTSIKNSLDSLNSTIGSLNSAVGSLGVDITTLQIRSTNLEKQLKDTQNTLTLTQTGFTMAIIIICGVFSGVLYYRERLRKQVK